MRGAATAMFGCDPPMDLSPLEQISAKTHGVFNPAMAHQAGFSRAALCKLRKARHISRVCGSALMLGSDSPTIEQRAIGARLTWPDAVVCERTAGVAHGLIDVDRDDGLTHVLVPNGRKGFNGLVAHHWSVRPTEVELRHGWTVTDRRTTLADCLGRFDDFEAWGIFAWLATRDKIGVEDVRAQIADRFHLYGVVRLRKMAAALARGAVSLAEVELLDFLKECGFTGWAGNQKIRDEGRIVASADVLFFAERLVIEFDGRLSHPDGTDSASRRKQRQDKARDRRLRRLGYTVLRVRWERLVHDREGLRQEIEALLSGRRAMAS